MDATDLTRLFDADVALSAGEIRSEHDVGLEQLRHDEVPSGYERWVEKRRREYRGGRHHARVALAHFGLPPSPILRDEDGVPLFPAGFSGSITHTGRESTFAAAVIARSPHRVGIDAEELRELGPDMVQYILSEDERRELSASGLSPFGDEGTLALLGFSAKEAFYKCIFPELRCRLGFFEVEFRLDDARAQSPTSGEFQLRLLRPNVVGAPETLKGRYLASDRHLVCGVTWPGLSRRVTG